MNEGLIQFKNEAKNINEYFTELNYREDERGSCEITGSLGLKDATGTLIDSYSIRIVPSERYPYRFPSVFETGGRLPVNIDWHIYPNGHCCLKTVPEEILLCKRGITLHWFIKEQVLPYFFNQKHRELYGYFLQERSHGILGDLEFFKEHFNTQDRNLVLRLLLEVQKVSELKSNSKCLCGSGRKFKKCHRRTIRSTKAFSQREINYFIGSVRACING
jgi:hypothetical protein